LQEELFLASRGAQAQHADRLLGAVMELMRGVRWDVDRLACADHHFLPAKRGLEFAFQNDKGFFKIVAMRRRPASGRNMHIDQTELPGRVVTGEQNGISVADYTDMNLVLVAWASQSHMSAEVIGRNLRTGSTGDTGTATHGFLLWEDPSR